MNNSLGLLRQVDLNLLVAFDALMQTRSVSRAAERCFLSQPAMSNALNRLRETLDDPLLVRSATGMRPSPRAQKLEGPIRSILEQLERELRPAAPFDPATTERLFRISLTDYGEFVVLPRLVEKLAERAPKARLESVSLTSHLPESALERGELDLVVAVQEYFQVPGRLRTQTLLGDRLVCLGSRTAYDDTSLTLKRYLSRRHVYPSPLGVQSNVVDGWLSAQHKRRDIALSAQSYLVAARIAAESDLLLSLPGRIARTLAELLPLRLIEPPRGFPDFKLCLIWHPLYAGDPAIAWLLGLFAELQQELEREG